MSSEGDRPLTRRCRIDRSPPVAITQRTRGISLAGSFCKGHLSTSHKRNKNKNRERASKVTLLILLPPHLFLPWLIGTRIPSWLPYTFIKPIFPLYSATMYFCPSSESLFKTPLSSSNPFQCHDDLSAQQYQLRVSTVIK